ncbi:MAG: MutH/Sau3AI family endonuclease [Clostridium sp.]|nr:MutH/Sau3AI family endonuclease [Clostridium sp.]MDU7082929.1 MutH/Sau3AI family endonuclease [Clostridium sp.]
MKLEHALVSLKKLRGKRFEEIFTEEQLTDIIKNKGKSGQIIELAIGLSNTNVTLDFEDGELKTNKCDANSKPLETMFITQISSMIDELINENSFENSKLFKKITNLLYVPISKDGQPKDWFIIDAIHIDLNEDKHLKLREQLKDDYYSICKQLREHIETAEDGFIHTSNGKYIQIRSKDSKPYFPIFSDVYDKYVSNKNHAFYFKKEFMKYVMENS